MNDPVSVSHVPGRFQSRQKPKKEFSALGFLANLMRISAAIVVLIAILAALTKLSNSEVPFDIFFDFCAVASVGVGIEIVAELILLAVRAERNTRK